MDRDRTDDGILLTGRREWLPVALVLLLGLALRLAYLREVADHPLFSTLTGDPAVYREQAHAILAGSPVPAHAYFHSSPLYPFFVALVERIGGASLGAVRTVQSVVGTASVLVVYLLGKLTVGRAAALVAALLAALYVPFIFFAAEFLEITLVIAFVLGALVLLVLADRRVSRAQAAAAGAMLGLAGLGKPNLLLIVPAAAIWLISKRGGDRGRGRARGRASRRSRPVGPAVEGRRLAAGVLVVLAAGAVVLPATIHNYRAESDFIPVSSNGGINFYIGNHTNSPGVFQVPPEMRFDLRVASKEAAERATGRTLSAGEVSDYWVAMAFREIRRAPGRWIGLLARKFVLFWNHYEIPNHYHLYYVRESAPVLRIPFGTFAVVAPLGLVGLALALGRRREVAPARGRGVGLLVVFGATFMASVIPFFITGRYRLAIAIPLLIGAGVAVIDLTDAARRRRWRRLIGACAAIGVIAVAVNVNTIEFSFAPMHNVVGAILGQRGQMEEAADAFRLAVETNPDDLSSRHNLGLALVELGRFGEAIPHFQHALAAHPRYYEVWIELGRAYAGAGSADQAREAWETLVRMDPPAPAAVVATAERLIATLDAPIAGDDTRSNPEN